MIYGLVGTIEILVPSGVTISGSPVCTLTPYGGSPVVRPCTYSDDVISLTTDSSTYSATSKIP